MKSNENEIVFFLANVIDGYCHLVREIEIKQKIETFSSCIYREVAVANLLEITICTNITSTTAKKTSQNSQKLNFITEEMLDARFKLKTKTTRTQHIHTHLESYLIASFRPKKFVLFHLLFLYSLVRGRYIYRVHIQTSAKFKLVDRPLRDLRATIFTADDLYI